MSGVVHWGIVVVVVVFSLFAAMFLVFDVGHHMVDSVALLLISGVAFGLVAGVTLLIPAKNQMCEKQRYFSNSYYSSCYVLRSRWSEGTQFQSLIDLKAS